jgi:hypothetical protein
LTPLISTRLPPSSTPVYWRMSDMTPPPSISCGCMNSTTVGVVVPGAGVPVIWLLAP